MPAAKTVMVESIVRRTREKKIAGDYGAAAEKIVTGSIFPALDRQIDLVKSLRKAATHDAGVWRLPKGDEYYADALMNATTSTLTPEEVHKIGTTPTTNNNSRIDWRMRPRGLRGSAAIIPG